MKRIFTILFFFIALACTGQSRVRGAGSPNVVTYNPGFAFADSGTAITSFSDTATANLGPFVKKIHGLQIKVHDTIFVRDTVLSKWIKFGPGGGGGTIGGPITSNRFGIGTNPGNALTTDQWITSVFYYAQPPLAALTGGGIFEFTSASIFNTTLNWSASRQSSTPPLTSITVAGTVQTFSQPTQPGTVSGTQAVAVTTNTVTTYNNVVAASDGQTGTASTTFTYRSKYYIGFIATSTPSDADIIAATGGAVGGTFATAFATSGSLPSPGAARFIVFAFPASFGTALIKINGLLVNYVLTTRSFTNASGYSVSYNIYVSPFSTNAGVDYQAL